MKRIDMRVAYVVDKVFVPGLGTWAICTMIHAGGKILEIVE
jgi:hypothetical protein